VPYDGGWRLLHGGQQRRQRKVRSLDSARPEITRHHQQYSCHQQQNGVDQFLHGDWLGSTRYLSDSTGNAGIHLSTRNSTIAGNATGGVVSVSAPAGGTPSVSMVDAATVSNDGGNGLNANGSGAILMVARSIISGNGTSVATSNGGTLQSYSDNDVLGNTPNTLPGTTPHN
jgi:hypothetical protein